MRFDLQPLQAFFAGVDRAPARSVLGHDLGDDENLIAPSRNGFADHFFGPAGGIHFSRIDEGHSEIETQAKRSDFLFAAARAIAHGPGALAERGNFFAGGKHCGWYGDHRHRIARGPVLPIGSIRYNSGMSLLRAVTSVLQLFGTGRSPAVLLNLTAPRRGYRVERDIAYGNGPRNRLDLYVPACATKAALPVIVFFYGGAFRAGRKNEYRFVGEALATRGILVAVPDYRIYPEACFPDFLDDAARAVVKLRQTAGSFRRRSGRAGSRRPFGRRLPCGHAGRQSAISDGSRRKSVSDQGRRLRFPDAIINRLCMIRPPKRFSADLHATKRARQTLSAEECRPCCWPPGRVKVQRSSGRNSNW